MGNDLNADDALESARVRTIDGESTVTLLERVRAGDQDAAAHLVARHTAPLRRWARGRLPRWARDVSDTDDLVQDTLLQTMRRLGDLELRGPGALAAYLRQAILNRVRDELRRKGRRPEMTGVEELEAGGVLSPLEEAIGRETAECYEHALAALRPEEREAIIGRVEMGYSYEELADVLEKPSSEAARKAAQRALVRLARLMSLPGT